MALFGNYSSRRCVVFAGWLVTLVLGSASLGRAQCSSADNRGWPQSATVRYFLDGALGPEQRRQIGIAIDEWNRANSVNNSRVRFVEDPTGQNAQFRFGIGNLGGNTPAFANKQFTVDGNVVSAALTYDPNAVFPGTSTLIVDPAKPGYDTILIKLTLHEMGHTMGLDHPTSIPGNICDQPNGVTIMNYVCGTNDSGNNLPIAVTQCDQNTINSMPLYPAGRVPSPATIQFTDSRYGVSEGGSGSGSSAAIVTVVRGGDATGEASVWYATTPDAAVARCDVTSGEASERCDFVATVGRLRFAPGQTLAAITIPVIDDAYAEGAETLRVSLSEVAGGSMGAVSMATVTIHDNDANSSPANPIDVLEFFVRQQYLDFLAREPEPAGFDGWMAKLRQCPPAELGNRTYSQDCTRIDVSAAFFRSPEFQLKGYYVYRFYQASYGVRPRYLEFVRDTARVKGATDAEFNENRATFPAEWVQRPSFRARYDSLSNAGFVDLLLQTAGMTSALAGRRDAWVGELNAGIKTRAQVLREVVESAEVEARFYTEAFVAMQYYGYLRRDPDSQGYAGWLEHLNRTGNYREMVWGFLYSPEYKLRFGPVPGF